jgi:transposase
MLSFSLNTKIFMAIEPVDMRRGFDSLAAWVDQNLGRKVLEGDVFLFLSKRRDRLKILWWEGDGYSLYYRRLEAGTFELPKHNDSAKELAIDATTLALLLRGIETGSIRMRKRYSRAAS